MRHRAISEISRLKFFPPISIPSELERARRTEMLYASPLVTCSLTFYENAHHKTKIFDFNISVCQIFGYKLRRGQAYSIQLLA
jgi:hypothetical protein